MNKTIIIGAGPAGLKAAEIIAQQGWEVLVLDEYMIAGGRLIGQLYEEPTGSWWNGVEEAKGLYNRAKNAGATIQLQTIVFNMERDAAGWIIYTNKGNYITNYLLLATGAAEQPFSIPGWTLPGVMSVGAAQVMTNVHRIKPGRRGIIIGVNVLSSAIAMELQLAGVDVACMTLPLKTEITKEAGDPHRVIDSLLHVSHMAPSLLVRFGSKLMKTTAIKKMGIYFYPKKGVPMWGIPIMLRKAVVEIYGKDVVEGVTLATISPGGEIIKGTEQQVQVDFVCIAGGLYPLAELASIVGCPFYYINELGGYVPLHNEKMETPITSVFVAGNITGIEGAKVAIAQGKVAGYSILNRITSGQFIGELQEAVEEVESVRQEAVIQFHPNIVTGKKKLQEHWNNYFANSSVK